MPDFFICESLYSFRKLCTGFTFAALMVCTLVIKIARKTIAQAANGMVKKPTEIR